MGADIKSSTSHVCPLCGYDRHRYLRSLRFAQESRAFDLWRCRDCGVVHNWPRLPDDAIHDLYDETYYVFAQTPQRRWSRSVQIYVNYLLPLERQGGGRLLEIGSACGHLLAIARARGWYVTGVELAASAADQARSLFGLDILTGTLETHAGQLSGFDVAISVDVIEHVPDPCSFVADLRGCLRGGGTLITETPNWGGLWRRLGGRTWIGQNPFHVFLFDARSLLRLLRSEGFTRCHAVACTNLAHIRLGDRPELMRWAEHMPCGVRWRVQRLLNRATPASAARAIRDCAPSTLEEALHCIDSLSRAGIGPVLKSPTIADNLAVIASAPATDNSAARRPSFAVPEEVTHLSTS